MTEAGGLVIDNFSNQYGEDMDGMSKKVEDFDTVFDDCIKDMESALTKYQTTVTTVNDAAGTSYDELREKIDAVSRSNDELATSAATAV